mmetsp:Transcript_38008/g.60223  ORF Transcript_38008/g.60223 Transcript_38008/m.60223 type:complete len:559 (-) Transcript_38008:190-1866(-)
MSEHGNATRRLKAKLQKASAFSKSAAGFINMLADTVQELRLEPGEAVFHFDDKCSSGTSPFYVIVEGKVRIENELDVCVALASEGEIFGEGGALGLTETRTMTVRAGDKPAVVLVLCGSTLEPALIAYPEERDRIEELFFKRTAENNEFDRQRETWANNIIVPALARTDLFAGCPEEFLAEVARPLNEISFKHGQTIATCGETADSMLVLLDGQADVEAKSGAKIGRIKQYATFGAVSALNLFSCRTVTLKAVGKCRVLHVTAKAFWRALDVLEEPLLSSAFSNLVESRHEQVRIGAPLTALPIQARADDVCVRAVALQAQRIDLAPGDFWEPLPDDHPCGPHFGIMVKGKALLETTEEKRLVTALTPGSLFPEGLAAAYNTRARAVTHCEAYRIRQYDFLVAVYSMPSAQDWFYRFRLMERQTIMHLKSRLSSVKGVTDVILPHSCDSVLHEWKARREHAIERARHLKVEKGNALAKLPLMAHSSPHMFLASEAGRAWRDEFYSVSSMHSQSTMTQSQSTMSRMSSMPDLHSTSSDVPGRGVGAHPAMRLPSLEVAS